MSSSTVQKIKERLSIVDVVSSYLSLTQNGHNYKAKCPFHNEKTPSFFVSPDRGSYYCFGCGEKGDIFSFVEQFEGTDFLGALKILAEKAGVPLDYNFSTEDKTDKDKLYKIMEEATTYFQNILKEEKSALNYLNDRGLKSQTIELFQVGYAPALWQSVSTHLIGKGYTKEDLVKVGLIKVKDTGSFYDRFRGRIIFPISDSSGRVIAFSGRIYPIKKKDDSATISEAKYLNSPETTIFSKSNTLFGIDKAKLSIKKRNYTIIVEGQFDLILSHQAGFTNTVAVSGTALSERTEEVSNKENKINNLGLVNRLSSNVIFAYDGDSAGIRAAGRSAFIALSLGMQVKIAKIKEGNDPADIISGDINTWKDTIKNSLDINTLYLDIICQENKDIRIVGKKVKEVIFPYLSVIDSSIERSSYISLIHKKTGIKEEDILKDFEAYSIKENKDIDTKNEEKIPKNNKSRKERLAERFFGVIFWNAESYKIDKEEKSKLVDEINQISTFFQKQVGEEYFNKLKETYEPSASVLAFEAEIWYGDKSEDMINSFKEVSLNLEEEILKDKLLYMNTDLYNKETKKSKDKINLLLKDYQQIVERIEKIKNDRRK